MINNTSVYRSRLFLCFPICFLGFPICHDFQCNCFPSDSFSGLAVLRSFHLQTLLEPFWEQPSSMSPQNVERYDLIAPTQETLGSGYPVQLTLIYPTEHHFMQSMLLLKLQNFFHFQILIIHNLTSFNNSESNHMKFTLKIF